MANAANIERAIIKHLQGLPPPWAMKFPGVPFTPDARQPWQRVTVMPGLPETVAFGHGAYSRVAIVAQVDLFYPVSERRTDILFGRAEAVRDWFFGTQRRGFTLSEAATRFYVSHLPGIGALIENDASFNQLPVLIRGFSDDCPAP